MCKMLMDLASVEVGTKGKMQSKNKSVSEKYIIPFIGTSFWDPDWNSGYD